MGGKDGLRTRPSLVVNGMRDRVLSSKTASNVVASKPSPVKYEDHVHSTATYPGRGILDSACCMQLNEFGAINKVGTIVRTGIVASTWTAEIVIGLPSGPKGPEAVTIVELCVTAVIVSFSKGTARSLLLWNEETIMDVVSNNKGGKSELLKTVQL